MKLTVKQAAERASVSPSRIYALLRSGRIQATRIGCRGKEKWLVDEATLDDFIKSCRTEVRPALPPLRHLR